MKKIVILLLAALLVLAVGCRKQEAEAEAPAEPVAQSGGWTPAADYTVTEERKAVFDKGLAELVGVYYAPVAYLGSQVVAGKNHVFLVKGTVAAPDAPVFYGLAYFYQDLQGGVKLMNVANLGIIPQADGTLAPVTEQLSGGWSCADDPVVTEEILSRLNQALEGLAGATYVPVANLATQVVAGLNRCLLCQVTPVGPDAQPHYALVYVYEDLQGGAQLLQVVDLDVGGLCEY